MVYTFKIVRSRHDDKSLKTDLTHDFSILNPIFRSLNKYHKIVHNSSFFKSLFLYVSLLLMFTLFSKGSKGTLLGAAELDETRDESNWNHEDLYDYLFYSLNITLSYFYCWDLFLCCPSNILPSHNVDSYPLRFANKSNITMQTGLLIKSKGIIIGESLDKSSQSPENMRKTVT